MDTSFRRINSIDLQALKKGILNQEVASLSKCITLVESQNHEHRRLAAELMESIRDLNPTFAKRIGITGVPGVGKSTFIEAFGKELTSSGIRLAVLSIDPSSARSRGSILGDKTRMPQLTKDPNAYIRPSASGLELGGVARATKDTITLCEAAGYDVVLVETVGVGQSETAVKRIVDYFLLLMLPGGGDELQGIKRGIMEMADHVIINKADGGNEHKAKQSAIAYKSALHLMPPHETDWEIPVELCSALEQKGIAEAWHTISFFFEKNSNWVIENRKNQNMLHFREGLLQQIEQQIMENEKTRAMLLGLENAINKGSLTTTKAIATASETILKTLLSD